MKQLSSPKTQNGVVLIIALVMLLLVTMIGVSSMRSTGIQENMAGNLRESTLSFQAAEAALRTGEQDVFNRYFNNTLTSLETASVSGENTHFTATVNKPSFELTMLANIKTSTEVGIPVDDEGMLVQVTGVGSGHAVSGNDAMTTTTLQSTYLVEK